ncbi:unnamed protein product [Taenia asiatica]|uniref:Secreted protein n=1 Tax=Taenia asiatica TaxID=60517 RepID=A0A0R3WH95_TAEAS|nr:unnamed protein product [Taenia asiatica]
MSGNDAAMVWAFYEAVPYLLAPLRSFDAIAALMAVTPLSVCAMDLPVLQSTPRSTPKPDLMAVIFDALLLLQSAS